MSHGLLHHLLTAGITEGCNDGRRGKGVATSCIGVDVMKLHRGVEHMIKRPSFPRPQGWPQLLRIKCAAESGEVPRLVERPLKHEETVEKGGGIEIGSRRFLDELEMIDFFDGVLGRTDVRGRVPRAHALILLALVIKAHPDPKTMIGCGVKFVFVDRHLDYGEKCFMLMRKDGSQIDVSYRKCIENIGSPRKPGVVQRSRRQQISAIILGNREFADENEVCNFFDQLVRTKEAGSRLDPHVDDMVLDLVAERFDASDAEKKIGPGLKYTFIGNHPESGEKCLMLMRWDGSETDIPYRSSLSGGEFESVGFGSQRLPLMLGNQAFAQEYMVYSYFGRVLGSASPGQPVDKEVEIALIDLLKKGHKAADEKIGCGVKTVIVDVHPTFEQKCFFVVRTDGSQIDFSYRKCVRKLFRPVDDRLEMGANRFDGRAVVKKPYEGVGISNYARSIIRRTAPGTRVGEEEQQILLDLLAKGHPRAKEKLGCGVDFIFVDYYKGYTQKCFKVMRTDGSSDDFSYRKCIRGFNKDQEMRPLLLDMDGRPGLEIGGRKFERTNDVFEHFDSLLLGAKTGDRIDEVETEVFLDLLAKGDPKADEKIGCGVDYIFVGNHPQHGLKCFLMMRQDETIAEFPHMTCIWKVTQREWSKDESELADLKDSASGLLKEKYAAELRGTDLSEEVKCKAVSIAEKILERVTSGAGIGSSGTLHALSGLASCAQIDKSAISSLLEHHRSLAYLLDVIDQSSEVVPVTLLIKRASRLSHLPMDNEGVAHVFSKLLSIASTHADVLTIHQLFNLLALLLRNEVLVAFNVEGVLSALKRKVIGEDFVVSNSQVALLADVLPRLGISSADYVKELDVTLSLMKGVENPIRLLRRFAACKKYPGGEVVNNAVQHVLKNADVGMENITTLWVSIILLNHKLPSHLLDQVLEIGQKHASAMDAKMASAWIWGFGRQALLPEMYRMLVKKVALAAQKGSKQIRPRQITSSLWSMAVLQQYALPEFKMLWSAIQKVPVKELKPIALSVIYQVSVAAELECPSLRLELSDAQFSAAISAWKETTRMVTVTRTHLNVLHTIRALGLKAVREYITSRHLFSVDIVLLPPGYPLDDGMESGVYESMEDIQEDFPEEPSDSQLHENSEGDPWGFESDFGMGATDEMQESTPVRLNRPPKRQRDMGDEAREMLEFSSDSSADAWLSGADESLMVAETLGDDGVNNEGLDVCEEDHEAYGDKDSIDDNDEDPLVHLAAAREEPGELRVQTSAFVGAPKEQIDVAAALACHRLPLVGIEIDGPGHHFQGYAAGRDKVGKDFLRERLLKKLGWTIVHISSGVWSRKTTEKQREYLLQKISRAGIDIDRFR